MMIDLLVALGIGVAFGAALERAGLGSARTLAGQFLLRDFTVVKVMFSAILTAMLGTFWLGRLGLIDVAFLYVPDTYLAPQLAGGAIFGVGFALAGLCPGTSCVSAATGRGDGAAAVGGLFTGVMLTGLGFPALQAFYQSGARGAWTLPQLFHLPYGAVVLLVVLAAIGAFAAAGWMVPRTLNDHTSSDLLISRSPVRRRRWIAIAALALGAAAAVAQTPARRGAAPAQASKPAVARPASGC